MELINKIDEAQGFIDCMKNEVMRVKREHFDNIERCTRIEASLSEVSKQIAEISEKQGLNDTGMATLFKIN
jgi:hypothetical protein